MDRRMTEALIDEVEGYPAIYDCKLTSFMDKVYKDDCWEQIAGNLNVESTECKKRWRSLRDSFTSIVRRANSGGSRITTWLYYERMKFYLPYTKFYMNFQKAQNERRMIDDEVSRNESPGPEIDADETPVNDEDNYNTINEPSVNSDGIIQDENQDDVEYDENPVNDHDYAEPDGEDFKPQIYIEPISYNNRECNKFDGSDVEDTAPKKRVKLEQNHARSIEQEDSAPQTPLHNFFASIAGQVQHFSNTQKLRLQLKCLAAVYEIEMEGKHTN